MTLSRAYFMCAVGIGLIFFSHLLNIMRHAGAEANNYLFAILAILWVPVSLVAIYGLRKKRLTRISPLAYVIYFVLNYFFSPQSQFNAEADATGIGAVTFGALYAALNLFFLYREIRNDKKPSGAAP